MMVFLPDSMSFDSYFDIHYGQSEHEMILRFGIGMCPALLHRKYFKISSVNLSGQSAPSTVSGTLACADMVSAEIIRLFRKEQIYPAPHSIQFDPYVRKLKRAWMPFGNRNPIQRIKLWYVRRLQKI